MHTFHVMMHHKFEALPSQQAESLVATSCSKLHVESSMARFGQVHYINAVPLLHFLDISAVDAQRKAISQQAETELQWRRPYDDNANDHRPKQDGRIQK